MHRRLARAAALAAGHVGASAARPAKPRPCGSLGVKVSGMPIAAVVTRVENGDFLPTSDDRLFPRGHACRRGGSRRSRAEPSRRRGEAVS